MLGQHTVVLLGDLQFEDDAPAVMAIPSKQALLYKFMLFKSADCVWLWWMQNWQNPFPQGSSSTLGRADEKVWESVLCRERPHITVEATIVNACNVAQRHPSNKPACGVGKTGTSKHGNVQTQRHHHPEHRGLVQPALPLLARHVRLRGERTSTSRMSSYSPRRITATPRHSIAERRTCAHKPRGGRHRLLHCVPWLNIASRAGAKAGRASIPAAR